MRGRKNPKSLCQTQPSFVKYIIAAAVITSKRVAMPEDDGAFIFNFLILTAVLS